MFRKALTYLTILAITMLPVQLINASAETLVMQISMNQLASSNTECLHEMNSEIVKIKSDTTQPCCDEPSNNCQGCNDAPQANNVMASPVKVMVKTSLLKSSKYSISHLALNGVPQKNLLRPPRNII